MMPNPTPPEPSLPEAVTDEELENIKARIARHEDWSVSVDRLIARIDQEREAREAAEAALARMDDEVADHISALVDTQSRLAAAEKVLEAAEKLALRMRSLVPGLGPRPIPPSSHLSGAVNGVAELETLENALSAYQEVKPT